jgi:hypothetical protein
MITSKNKAKTVRDKVFRGIASVFGGGWLSELVKWRIS